MTDIASEISDLKSIIADQKQQQLLNLASEKQLQKKLVVRKTVVQAQQLEVPAIVCTDKKCYRIGEIEDQGYVVFKRKCHDRCGDITDVPPNCLGASSLNKCEVLRSGVCTECEHPSSQHMLILVDYEENTEVSNDPEVERELLLLTKKMRTLDLEVSSREIRLERLKKRDEERKQRSG